VAQITVGAIKSLWVLTGRPVIKTHWLDLLVRTGVDFAVLIVNWKASEWNIYLIDTKIRQRGELTREGTDNPIGWLVTKGAAGLIEGPRTSIAAGSARAAHTRARNTLASLETYRRTQGQVAEVAQVDMAAGPSGARSSTDITEIPRDGTPPKS
jgi:hypothetical protein